MLSDKKYTYYQPERRGISLANLADNVCFSFMAFRNKKECEEWLVKNGHNPQDFDIIAYSDDDIEDVVLIDSDGKYYQRIEDIPDDDLIDLITDEVMMSHGSIDNLRVLQQSDETDDAYKDRVYGEALDLVNEAIVSIEEDNEFNFASYAGTPETEWYDEARDDAVLQVTRWLLGEE